ncbi:MAG: NTP transferase domain-containing protein [Rhizobiaceae bacterium]
MIVAIIPAKGQSGRLPNKNMSLINGRPMIDYTIRDAQGSKLLEEIYVSTDHDAIASHASQLGIPVIRRPESLGGETPIIEVYRHAVQQLNNPDISIVVGLQPDHPDREVSIDEALSAFQRLKADCLVSVEADGTKNGAHYIMARSLIDGTEAKDIVEIVDDCTNIHFAEDLERAAARLAD